MNIGILYSVLYRIKQSIMKSLLNKYFYLLNNNNLYISILGLKHLKE